MGTQINVTVDRGGLLERNKQQTNANRQARLEQDAQSDTEAEAQQKRTERLAADGLNADGTPKVSSYPKTQRADPQPAAFRTGSKVYMGPLYAPVEVSETDPVVSIEEPNLAGALYITGGNRIGYSFVIDDVRVKGPAPALTSNRGFYRSYAFERQYYVVPFDWNPTNQVPSIYLGYDTQTIAYGIGEGPNGANAIIINHDYTYFGSFIYLHDNWYEQSEATTKRLNIEKAQWTTEFYVKATANAYSYLLVRFYSVQLLFESTGTPSTIFFEDSDTTYEIDYHLSSLSAWTHVALVFAAGQLSVYINGQFQAQAAAGSTKAIAGLPTFSLPGPAPNTAQLSLSSLRVVDRAIYRNNFTPPLVIR